MPKVGRRGDHFVDYPRRNSLLADAPFGTIYTPQTRVRIVGSRLHAIQDEPITMPINLKDVSPRLDYLEKDLTKRLERLEKSVYNGSNLEDLHSTGVLPPSSPTHPLPPHKQSSLNPHAILPPITAAAHDAVAARNDAANDAAYDAVYDDPFEEIKLYEPLPRDRALTNRPVELNDEQTTLLYRLLSEHCSLQDTPRLKEIYLSLCSHDLKMTGHVPFEALRLVFHRHQVFLPLKMLRLLGSMYVAPSGTDMVNYEQILIFIGAALKNVSNRALVEPSYRFTEDKNKLMNPALLSFERPSYYQYEKNGGSDQSPRFDVERLRQGFLLADRTHRGTLSQQQIKEVVRSYGNLDMTESLLDEIVQQCDECLGQIKWEQFLQHIERVQPLRTGLHIPASRRPRDMARKLPTPNDSWPRDGAGPLPRRLHNGSDSNLSSPRNGPIGGYSSPRLERWNEIGSRMEYRSKMNNLESSLRDMEDNYQKNKEDMLRKQSYGPNDRTMSPMSKNWFSRFMKLADALYKNDVDHKGYLRAEEVRWLMAEYNDIYNLSIPLTVQEKALQEARRGGAEFVDINTLVNHVAKTRMSG